jgi:hypothetical protein
MIYTNDETDKSVRQKNFILTVYAFPIAVAIAICGLIYLATSAHYLTKNDAAYGYMSSLTAGTILFAYSRKNWLKMPDGTYHNIKGVSQTTKINTNEPTEYEVEYFPSKKQKITSVLIGTVLIGFGVWAGLKNTKTILVPIGMAATGVFITYMAVKSLLDKSPKLKLATTGIWTKKLGFVNYNDLIKAQIIEDTSGKSPQTILEIFLKGTVFAEANQPDERLYLNDIDGKQYIEMVLVNLMRNHNEITA